MSPIVTTMSAPAGRSRRVKAPAASGGGGGSWVAGAGANAPSWSGKTTYTAQQFQSPIPTASEVNGLRGFQGFDGTDTWLPTRVTYPTTDTPFGTQKVLQIQYPATIENITANAQSTTAYPWAGAEYTNIAVTITGTWSGTLVFETSVDGTTWTSQTMTGRNGSSSGSSTTVNGHWTANSSASIADYDFFRVRSTSWTSGTAVVTVGMQGGQAPARATIARFTGTPTRMYARVGLRTSSNWNDNGNSGTKLFFFWQKSEAGQSVNHYVNLTDSTASGLLYQQVGFQFSGGPANANYPPSSSYAHGAWRDVEFIAEAGTAGTANGVVKVWVDGTLVVNQSGILMTPSLMTPGFTTLFLDPTFGGGFYPPVNQTLQIAHVYTESAA